MKSFRTMFRMSRYDVPDIHPLFVGAVRWPGMVEAYASALSQSHFHIRVPTCSVLIRIS